MSKINIVLPIYNEENNPYFLKNCHSFLKYHGKVEPIIVDGGSTDNTLKLLEQFPFKVVEENTMSRAKRINKGIKKCENPITIIHHPRSFLDPVAFAYLLDHSSDLVWGGFTHQFDTRHPLLSFTSWYSNTIRPRTSKILYLDHCFYAQTKLLKQVIPIPEVDIFEDTLLSIALSKIAGTPRVLPFISQTSAIRFKQNGIYTQALKNQYLKFCYYLGVNHKRMNKTYEGNEGINTTYKS